MVKLKYNGKELKENIIDVIQEREHSPAFKNSQIKRNDLLKVINENKEFECYLFLTGNYYAVIPYNKDMVKEIIGVTWSKEIHNGIKSNSYSDATRYLSNITKKYNVDYKVLEGRIKDFYK